MAIWELMRYISLGASHGLWTWHRSPLDMYWLDYEGRIAFKVEIPRDFSKPHRQFWMMPSGGKEIGTVIATKLTPGWPNSDYVYIAYWHLNDTILAVVTARWQNGIDSVTTSFFYRYEGRPSITYSPNRKYFSVRQNFRHWHIPNIVIWTLPFPCLHHNSAY